MRRTAVIAACLALALAACGDDGDDDSAENVAATATPSAADTAAQDAEEGGDAGADSTDDATTEPSFEDVGPPPTNPDKPDVELPDELPTTLERTVLEEGFGEPAAEGDTVVVDYVGVLSADGTEFDNSYEREPFPVTIGVSSVIEGWTDGLVGAMTGERFQLDIPSDQAYGPQGSGSVIPPDAALTFVIDVRSVVKPPDPGDAPTEPGVPLSDGATETTFEDLTVGPGDELAVGKTALLRYTNFRGDNGVPIESNWNGEPLQIPFTEGLLPGLLEGMDGMKVGGRRAIVIPPDDGFGPDGNPQGGLPAGTDMIFVVDLLGVY